MAQHAADFWDACAKEDWVGNSFEDLPLMQRVKKWDKETCKGIMLFTAGSPGVPTYTTYFHDYDIYLGDVAVQVPGNMNLLRAEPDKRDALRFAGRLLSMRYC